MARLAPKAKVCGIEYTLCEMPFSFRVLQIKRRFQVLRDGKWTEQEAAVLVPGDIISIKLGDIIPADARLLEGDPLKIDQVI